MIYFKEKRKGFTLVETLVSLSIFSIAVVSLLSVTSDGVSSFTFVKNKIIASYLAQEGIEYIRNVRDTELALDGQDGWGNFLGDRLGSCYNSGQVNNYCYIDAIDDQVNSCVGVCPMILYSDETGYYNYTAGNPTSFRRVIYIQSTSSSSEEVLISSSVSWSLGNRDHEVLVNEYLFNWR